MRDSGKGKKKRKEFLPISFSQNGGNAKRHLVPMLERYLEENREGGTTNMSARERELNRCGDRRPEQREKKGDGAAQPKSLGGTKSESSSSSPL